jgi:hypothetical protein
MGLLGGQSREIEDSKFTSEFRTMSTAILLLVVFQTGITSAVSPPRVQTSPMAPSAAVASDSTEKLLADEAAYDEREFIRRLNGLSRALNAFAETYKSGQVDLNKVKAVRKAMHELEKSEWFRPQKAK